MFQHHVKVLPVVDDRRRLVGVVSRAQVLKMFLRSDESIRKEVVRSLADAPALELGGSELEVKDGVVNVYGMAETHRAAELIVPRVMAVPGVVGIRYHPALPSEPAVAEMSHGGRHG